MSKKVFIGVGHGGNDPGAVGYLREEDVNLTMALACRDYLVANGVEVKMSRTKDENDPLAEEIRECNAYNPDLAIDCHNNAGKGDGFEAIYSKGSKVGVQLAKNIEAEVKKLGQNSRGVYYKLNSSGMDYFGFVRQTKCPAVICEGLFVDNAKDVKIADTKAEQKAFGVAYAKGILKTLGMKDNGGSKPDKPNKPAKEMYRVRKSWKDAKSQIGAYESLENAKKACKAGYTVYNSAGKSVYTKSSAAPATSAYYKKYPGKSPSVDTVFKEIGVPEKFRGNWSKRKPIATKNGISGYRGTATQNNRLISLAKAGKLKKV